MPLANAVYQNQQSLNQAMQNVLGGLTANLGLGGYPALSGGINHVSYSQNTFYDPTHGLSSGKKASDTIIDKLRSEIKEWHGDILRS